MLSKLFGTNWKRKYNTMCVKFEEIADKKINYLEQDRNILLKNIQYREEIDKLKKELTLYKRKYGRLKVGDKNGKNKSKR
ncbi:MAG: hypothetical protein VZQ62_00410 [Methanosphaera sp.]|nr:hypothetical protein [Methanosphaera sp.]